MPAFIAALLVGLVPVLTSWVFQLLLSLGVGFVTFTGVTAATGALHSYVIGLIGGQSATFISMLGLMRVDQGFNLILSAVAMRFTLQGLTGGGLRKMVFKAPA